MIKGEPRWDSMPQAKIINYPLEKGCYRPYAQAKVCMSERHLYIRMLAFEVDPEKESCLVACVSGKDGKYLKFRTTREGAFSCTLIDEGSGKEEDLSGKANIRITGGEDEQGIYWCVDYIMPLEDFSECFGGADVCGGRPLRANFYKICDGERKHYGSWSPCDFTSKDPFGTASYGDLVPTVC